jgi:hypothetical protein
MSTAEAKYRGTSSIAAPRASERLRQSALALGSALLVVAAVVQGIALSADPSEQQSATAKSESEPAGKSAPDAAELDAAPPELLYLTWQKGGWKKTGDPTPHKLWDRDGNFLTDEKSAEVLKQVQSFSWAWRDKESLNPLVLICKIDPRLTSASVMPTVIDADGKRHWGGFGAFAPAGQGMSVSQATPQIKSLAEWPGRISLELVMPIDDDQVILELDKLPDGVVDVAEGVTWYFDPARAVETTGGKRERIAGATAGVLQQPDTPPGTPAYSFYTARVTLKDGMELAGGYTTINLLADGRRDRIDVTPPIKDVSEIAHIQFLRRRFRTTIVHDVPLRIYDMPEEEAQ